MYKILGLGLLVTLITLPLITLSIVNAQQPQEGDIRLGDRIGMKGADECYKVQNRVYINDTCYADNTTMYLCIQVDMSSTDEVCKYWGTDEIISIFLNPMNQSLEDYRREHPIK